MIVNPGIRRFLVSTIQRLFNSAAVELPLTHTVIPTRGTLTPSFTRATTETGQKWDDNGYLNFTALAGEIVFKGARREYNQWTTSSITLASGGNKSLTLAAGTYQFSMGTGTGTATFSGTGGATGTLGASASARVSVAKTITAGTLVITASVADLSDLQICNITGETDQTTIRPYVSVGALIHDSQDPNYLSLPGTAGHYASTPDSVANSITGDIDIRCKVAMTDWTPAAETALYSKYDSTGNNRSIILAVQTTGVPKLYYSLDGSSANTNVATVAVTDAPYSFVNGSTYWLRVTRTASTGVVYFYVSTDGVTWTQLGNSAAGIAGALYDGTAVVELGTTVVGTTFPASGKIYSAQIYNTIDGITPVVDFNPNRDATTPTGTLTSSATGEVWTINGASSVVRNAAYHSSMVDGVKVYDTDRSGNPIATTGSYPIVGYVPWEAQNNIALQSNAFTTTWASNALSVLTQNAIGPDGATSAWTLTDAEAVLNSFISQSIPLTAAAYTLSLFVKKTTGATSFPVLLWYAAGATQMAGVTIDTNNGVATNWTAYTGFTMASGTSAMISSYNSAFWRVELTKAGTAAAHEAVFFPAATTNATQSTGAQSPAVTGSAVFYGAMVNLGAFAGPYIPTTTVAVARNADVLTYTGADVANIKTLACTFSRGVGVATAGTVAALSDNTANEYSSVSLTSATAVRFDGVDGGVSKWQTTASNAYTPAATSKAAYSAATNSIKMDLDGTAQTEDTVATLPTVTQAQIGHLNGATVLNGPVNHIYGWTRNLSQSELGAVDHA
jgi:hypothetical protein